MENDFVLGGLVVLFVGLVYWLYTDHRRHKEIKLHRVKKLSLIQSYLIDEGFEVDTKDETSTYKKVLSKGTTCVISLHYNSSVSLILKSNVDTFLVFNADVTSFFMVYKELLKQRHENRSMT